MEIDCNNTTILTNVTMEIQNTTNLNTAYGHHLLNVKSINETINCIFIIICAPFIIGGNLMVIISVIRFQRLKTVMNFFITSLAVADLLVGFPTIPLYVLFYAYEEIQGIKYLCLLKYTFVLISLPASILNLFIVTVDRFIAVKYPLHYNYLMTKKRARILIILVWTYSISTAALPLMGLNHWVEGLPCDFWVILPRTLTMITVPGTLSACIPSTIFMYIIVLGKARKAKRQILKYKSKTSLSRRNLSRDTRMAKMMCFVFLIFLLFWIPFFTSSLLKYLNFHTFIIEMVKQCSVSLTMANSLINPLIYGWMKPDFRNAFKKILRFKKSLSLKHEDLTVKKRTYMIKVNIEIHVTM